MVPFTQDNLQYLRSVQVAGVILQTRNQVSTFGTFVVRILRLQLHILIPRSLLLWAADACLLPNYALRGPSLLLFRAGSVCAPLSPLHHVGLYSGLKKAVHYPLTRFRGTISGDDGRPTRS